jgi:signal transduction histidine kinase
VKLLASLRARLLLAALAWTVGLFLAAFVLFTFVMLHNPAYPRVAHGAAYTYAGLFTAVAAVCLVAGVIVVRRGVSPLEGLRARLLAVRDGRERRIGGDYPWEVQPLVDDLNTLLSHRERMVRRAQARAGDLAHGLKTPLAVLAHEAARLSAGGHGDASATMIEQVERMRRQIEYHLAQARAAASGDAPGAQCQVLASAEALARTLRQLYLDRGVAIEVDVPADHVVRAQREDLDEMLGNLVDNACKWARRRVAISSSLVNGGVEIAVDDDGPGIGAEMRERVLQRGVRADEAAPGSGLGLAIVRDLAELHGGAIALADSPHGGLRARLRLRLP